ncbi:hypothetical protein [Georgenia alba]|uniref:Transcriptional regulator n=1 Tax=Georgenia alba TaxID=2233858 RepID=A0ABW2Q724_9MICO
MPPRRRHRRVVRLSEVDRRRLEAGELEGPVQALHARDEAAPAPQDEDTRSGDDERLLRDVPPHWGRH